MNRKSITRDERIITGVFSLFFVIGLWLTRSQIVESIQVIAFHILLLVNTYFSIQCFSPITPRMKSQSIIDAFLVLMYALLPLAFTVPSVYILLIITLFLIASLKYAVLLGVIPDLRLLRRKITIDLLGVLWNFFIFIVGGMGLFSVDLLLWIWVGTFAISNVYLLKIKPMYCLTTP